MYSFEDEVQGEKEHCLTNSLELVTSVRIGAFRLLHMPGSDMVWHCKLGALVMKTSCF